MRLRYCDITKVNPEDDYNYFFGYYDKCPWNKEETKVLCHRAKRELLYRFPNPDDEVELGVIDLATKKFVCFARTTAWNWQQGAQLQWIDWKGRECAIYNIRNENNEIVACIFDFATNKAEYISSSIYTVRKDGKYAVTLNYARLYDCRKDYGISGLKDPWYAENSPKDDGIFIINMVTGEKKLIVSTKALEETSENKDYINGFKQRENHAMFNPSGTRFCFMHRYFIEGHIQQSRLFTSDIDGKDIRLVFEGFVSHYDWRDDETILAWAGKRKLIATNEAWFNPMKYLKKILKPIYYAMGKPRILMQKVMGDSFYLIKDKQEKDNSKRIGFGVMYCDGHCTYSPDKRWILTDGYTDSENKLPLFLYDTTNGELYEIGRYHTPKELDGELRIDLHPRFNHDGSKVLIDSGMAGKRDMYIIDVRNITKQ